MTCTHKKATVFLLLLALLTGLFAMPGHAQDMNAYQVSVQWMDDWGETQSAYATPIPYQGYEMGYWLQLPYGVQPWRAALYIQDLTGIHTSFSLPNGTLLENVPEAGDNLSSAQPIEITGFTQDGNPGVVLRLYVSTMAPLPQDPSTPVIMPANVKVHYVDAATNAPIASDTEKTIYQSGEVVTPEAWDLQPNYELTGEASYTITLDYNGASPAEVTFYYNKQAPQPANVKVHYVDAATNAPIASDTEKTIYQSGEVVTPEAWDLQPNYELTGESSYTITLDYNGASPAEVTFYYNKQAPQPANVKVHYVDAATNAPIASDTEKTIYQSGEVVTPEAWDLQPNYELTGEASYTITLDYNGASPAEVTFYYNKQAPQPANVKVHYVDAATNAPIASDTEKTIYQSGEVVTPEAWDLQPNYELTGEASYTITLDYNGASPAEVTFYYNQLAPQPANVKVHYVDAATNAPIASDTEKTIYQSGEVVTPEAWDLQPNYELTGEASYTIILDYNGASPAEVTFYYNKQAPQPANVKVHYVDAATNAPIASDTEKTIYQSGEVVTPEAWDLQPNYELTGESSYTITLDYNGASPAEVTFYYNKQAPQPANVKVHYVDAATNAPIASDTEKTIYQSGEVVTPEAWDLQPNYELTGESSYTITLDYNGASPADVTFYYNKQAPQPANVKVHYVDAATNAPIASDTEKTVYQSGEVVTPEPFDLQPNYELTGESSYTITLDYNGASPAEVTFYYNKQAPQPANVKVHYVDAATNAPIASDTEKTIYQSGETVIPEPFDLQPNYELTGESSYTITLDYNGASPAEVTFYYNQLAPQPANVKVHYVDAATNAPIASDTEKTIYQSGEVVTPEAWDLQPNYELTGESSYTITLDYNGASPAEVTFYYNFNPPATEVPTEAPTEVPTEAPTEVPATPAPVEPVTLPVLYLDIVTSMPVATESSIVCQPGTVTDVYPTPADLLADYRLSEQSATMQQVSVDEMGYANVYEVVFYYEYVAPATEAPTEAPTEVPTEAPTEAPATPAPVEPVTLPVLYLDIVTSMPVATEGSVVCQPGTVTDVYPTPADLLADYRLSEQSAAMQQVSVDEMGYANVYEVVFYYEYVAPATEVPATAEPIQPTEIVISYYSTDAVQIAESTTFLCQPGENTIKPNQPAIGSEWILQSEENVTVILDDNGLTPASVSYYYQQKQPDATPAPMPVTIRYVDKQGNTLRPDENRFLPMGDHPISAPETLDDAYVLESDATVIVHVSEYGAEPSIVLFKYGQSAQAPKISLVTVKYVDAETGSALFQVQPAVCTEGVENLISVDWQLLTQMGFGHYTLQSPDTVSVTVDENGIAYPTEVVFAFAEPVIPTQTPVPTAVPTPEMPVTVKVYFRNEQGMDIAPAQEIPCYVGNNTIECAPVNILPNYRLNGESYQTVVLSDDGLLTPEMVVFNFVSALTPPPATASPFPYQYTPLDKWCYPTGDGINFRSEPTTAGGGKTVIRSLKRTELGHITGMVINEKGEEWYMVEMGDTFGFLKTTVTRVLSDQEVAKLFGYTPVPATPSPSPIPEGTAIDLWAKTNAKVFFRSSMETGNSNKLGQLKKDTPVWVLQMDSVEGQQWYQVIADGQEGYIMAEFVDLMSRQESDRIQASLASPMPTSTPLPTPFVPTAEPTFTPVPTEIPTPVPTATPVPYTGYALTLWQVPLRTGVTDDTILEWLPADSLVYVNGQTYVNGESWSTLRSMESGNYGFIQHNALMLISNEQAQPYLDMITQMQNPTTPEPQQQYGYAMTLGDGVPLRSFADTNAEIMMQLPFAAVASVRGQVFAGGTTWHLVQYNGMWGYVRADQMRMMSEEEVQSYLQSLEKGTPLPTEVPYTPAPITQESLSSYGHVQSNSGKVNMRSEPSTEATRLKLLDNYAFALVMGSETGADGKTWYKVSQAGTEGYIQGDYFKVLTLSELTLFLQSDEYQNANSQTGNTGSTSGQIQPVEDYNQTIWQNPALMASYEPFNPYATPTIDPERLPTASPVPTMAPQHTGYITPTPLLAPIQGSTTPTPETSKDGGSVLPWLLMGTLVIGGGGAVYAWSLHQQNERRRQAVRAQQARQAQSRQNQAQQPQMRMAPPAAQQTRSYNPQAPQQTGSYAPVRTQQPAAPQNTQAFRPQQTAAPQNTQAFKPQQSPQTTQAFRPQQPAAPQNTQASKPPVPTETAPAGESATPRRRRSDKYNS